MLKIFLLGHYTCECPLGYDGYNCERDIDECKSYPCKNHATCINLENDYNCLCDPGYEGRNCEIDINDCEVNIL